jgi:amidophosphoribosyltransferase
MKNTAKENDFNLTNPFDDDRLREECGVFGIFGAEAAAAATALGLHALQHRGQESAGIVTFSEKHFSSHRAMGQVDDIFNSKTVMDGLPGNMAIGHVRYSTSGDKQTRNIQPVFAEFSFGGLAIAHNGNLTNARKLRQQLIAEGAIFQSTMDTEIIIHLLARSKKSRVLDRVCEALSLVEGAYSLVALTGKKLIAVRDPLGVRPLVMGRWGNAYVFASESCAFDIIGATVLRELLPGEIVVVDADGVHSSMLPVPAPSPRFCVFEYVYFARPDSHMEGRSVYAVRRRIGAELALESPVAADIVVPVPDSGVPAALGYATQAGIPFELGIIRNHYVGRTFIEPTDQIRHLGVKLKHNANRDCLAGKRVVLVDDSIVRGTTSEKIVTMVREAGASEVHMRIASPPTTNSCFYGVDTPERSKLIAAQFSVDEIAKKIGVDSLRFISIDGLYRAVGEASRNNDKPQFCDACFSGEYPTVLTDENSELENIPSLLRELDSPFSKREER